MKNKTFLKENELPVISMEQLQRLFADFILWYDEDYCKNQNGANEVVGDYFNRKNTSQSREDKNDGNIESADFVIGDYDDDSDEK